MTVHRLAHPHPTVVPGLVTQLAARVQDALRWARGRLGVAVAFAAPVIWLAAWFMLFRSAVQTGTWF
jgi:hypothetical protein